MADLCEKGNRFSSYVQRENGCEKRKLLSLVKREHDLVERKETFFEPFQKRKLSYEKKKLSLVKRDKRN